MGIVRHHLCIIRLVRSVNPTNFCASASGHLCGLIHPAEKVDIIHKLIPVKHGYNRPALPLLNAKVPKAIDLPVAFDVFAASVCGLHMRKAILLGCHTIIGIEHADVVASVVYAHPLGDGLQVEVRFQQQMDTCYALLP